MTLMRHRLASLGLLMSGLAGCVGPSVGPDAGPGVDGGGRSDAGRDTGIAAPADASCDGEVRVVGLGGMWLPPPEDLVALAAETRAAGGVVFLGSVAEAVPAASEIVPSGPAPGLELAYPRTLATITVHDDLGAGLDAAVALLVKAGPPVVVDEAGAPQCNWAISESVPPWEERNLLPGAGAHVFFTSRAPDRVLMWAAPFDGTSASGVSTTSGAPSSLDALRLPPLP